MGLFDKTAMNAAFKRLVRVGVAPGGETPQDYEMSGSGSAAGILLLTNRALYAGWVRVPGARRLPLEDILQVVVRQDRLSPGPHYFVIDRTGDTWTDLPADGERKSFRAAMARWSDGPYS